MTLTTPCFSSLLKASLLLNNNFLYNSAFYMKDLQSRKAWYSGSFGVDEKNAK
jgi:hypothetical protein